MIKIGLLSDTHSELDERIFHHFKEVDEIWHAGDIGDICVIDQLAKLKPIKSVYGNIDNSEIRKETNEFLFFERNGLKILMIHIGGKPGRYSKRSYELIKKHKPDVFVCGHSHILFVQHDKSNQMICLNPGACGYKGFHKVRTILRFDIDLGSLKNLEVIELGNRSKLIKD